MKKKRTAFRTYSEYYVFLIFYTMIRLMPLKLCYFFAGMLARFLYHLPTRHKKRVLQHLVHAGLSTDEAHAAPMAKKIFIHFTKTVALGASKMA